MMDGKEMTTHGGVQGAKKRKALRIVQSATLNDLFGEVSESEALVAFPERLSPSLVYLKTQCTLFVKSFSISSGPETQRGRGQR